MNESIIRKISEGKLSCPNCKCVVKFKCSVQDVIDKQHIEEEKFECTCKSITGLIDYNYFQMWLLFQYKENYFDCLYNAMDNETKITIAKSMLENNDEKSTVTISNYCPFEHSVGKIAGAALNTALLS